MAKIQIHGRISPPYEITISDHPIFGPETTEYDLNIDLSITKGIVLAIATIDVPITDEIVRYIVQAVLEIGNLAIDLLAFKAGRSISLNLDLVTYEDGTSKNLFFHNSYLPDLVTAFTEKQLVKVIMEVGQEVDFLYAIRDLIDGLTPRRGAEIHCARSIETIRTLMAGAEHGKKDWKILQDTLHLTKKYLKVITDSSQAGRHGNRTQHLVGVDYRAVLERSWVVMNRYLAYRLKGSQPLSEQDFPWLD